MLSIRVIQLPIDGIEALAQEARAEGYRFVDRLLEEWVSDQNRFSDEGEILLGVFIDGQLVGVGGLNKDPFAHAEGVGRVRRVYVRAAWRGRGVGNALVSSLVEHARRQFHEVRLRAENADAARLYERMGFSSFAGESATHRLCLTSRQSDT